MQRLRRLILVATATAADGTTTSNRAFLHGADVFLPRPRQIGRTHRWMSKRATLVGGDVRTSARADGEEENENKVSHGVARAVVCSPLVTPSFMPNGTRFVQHTTSGHQLDRKLAGFDLSETIVGGE